MSTGSTGSTGSAGDAASVTVLVRVPPAEAFAIFTREIDLWWRRGPAYRAAGKAASRLTLEAGVGGRLVETIAGKKPREVELARVTRWEPPGALALEWRGPNFAPHERTQVEVAFRTASGGTLVSVRHFGWSTLREDHPARHGHVGADFSAFLGSWWAGLASALREHVSTHGAGLVFAYATDDRTLRVFSTESEAVAYCEGIDVEDGVWCFFDADGQPLDPVFSIPNERGRLSVSSGQYSLRASSGKGAPTLLERLGEVGAVEGPAPLNTVDGVRRLLTRGR